MTLLLQQHLPTSVSEGGEVEVSDGNEPDDRKRCPLPNAIQHKNTCTDQFPRINIEETK